MAIKKPNGCVDDKRIDRSAKKCAIGSSPVQKLSNMVLCEAAKHGATQIRIALSEEDAIILEYEVNGEWKPVNSPPRKLLEAIMTQFLMVNEFGPGGIPIVSDDSDAVAQLRIGKLDLKIELPKGE